MKYPRLAVFALALAFGPSVHGAPSTAAGLSLGTAAVGQPAPAFTLRTVDGRNVSLADYRGKTLVVNVWATWCPPCREETPELAGAYERLRSRNVAFIGVDTTEGASIVRAFAAAKNVPYDEAVDDSHAFARAYDVHYYPTTFVIDPQGIVRERHSDVASFAQMLAFVAAASRGRTAPIASALQRRIDALLMPNHYAFSGSPANVRAEVLRAAGAIDKADAASDDSDAATGNTTDFARTQAEESALRERAIAALAAVARNRDARALLWRLRGDDAFVHERWNDSAAAYEQALRANPKMADAIDGFARAQSQQHHEREALAARERLAALDPSPDNDIDLALAYASRSDWARARRSSQAAIAAAERNVRAKPHDVHVLRIAAWTHLYAGRIEARAGDRDAARADFTRTTAWAEMLPRTDARYAMYLEEAQEATVALGLGGDGSAVVSLAPWTGPDLPGSVESTLKYRLVVVGTAGRSVALTASGLPKHWIASFCSDRLCSPFHTSVVVPSSGVKVVEFQVIPEGPPSRAPVVRIDANDGGRRVTVDALVRAG